MADDDRVVLVLDDNNQVVINKFGATVISWICNGKEVLFVSSKAVFDNKKAIRGGIPVVFPNFGPWQLGPQHGFARISMWNLASVDKADNLQTAVLTLSNNSFTQSMWNHEFNLTYKVTLSKASGLTCELTVENTGQSEFDYTTLLHTYIGVNNVETTTVSHLSSLKYIDKLKEAKEFTEDRDLVTVVGGADSVYKSTGLSHDVCDSSSGLRVCITKQNLPDTVVWNPWVENAKKMSDFGDDEYKLMICVEPGSVVDRVLLGSGESKSYQQNIQVKS